MKRTLLYFFIALLFTSCATILNDKTYVVNIHSNEPNIKVKVQDSIYNLPVTTEIERSKKDLVLTVLKEPKNMEFRVKPKLSGKLLLNIPLLVTVIPGIVATAIDLDNYKKNHYGKSLYLNTKDSTVTNLKPDKNLIKPYIRKKYRRKKGDFYLNLSLPYVNWFSNKPLGESRHRTWGFWGISAGLDYYHKKDQFLNISASAVTDYPLPFPAIIEHENGAPETNFSSYISLSNNHKIKRLSLGYGLSYSYKRWIPGDGVYASNTTDTQNNHALGLIFPAYFQLGKTFNIGVIYRPTFYRFTSTDQFQYEHLISLDFAWKIKL